MDIKYLQDKRVLAESRLYNERLKNDILREEKKILKIKLKSLDCKFETQEKRLSELEFHFAREVKERITELTGYSFLKRLKFLFKGE